MQDKGVRGNRERRGTSTQGRKKKRENERSSVRVGENVNVEGLPTVAIVGRPNVGKSSLFNQLAGRSIAIVHDEPGITRDRLNAPCQMTTRACMVVDTGGIGSSLDDGFADAVLQEAQMAMSTANLILLVLDCRDDLTSIDVSIADYLRKAEVPVWLVLNKADHAKQELNLGEFASLGFDNYTFTSAAHKRGFSELGSKLDKFLASIAAPTWEEVQSNDAVDTPEEGSPPVPAETRPLRVAIVGRPNAGKSSLINAVLQDERTIVSAIAGTTRDAVDVPYSRGNRDFTLIDTAGLRPRGKRDTSVEVFSAMRSERAIRRSDICLLVVDVAAGITQQDRRIASVIAEECKPCIIVANKFDLFHPGAAKKDRKEEAEEMIRRELFFIAYAPFVCVSALNGEGMQGVFKCIDRVEEAAQNLPTTSQLNRVFQDAMQANPPTNSKSPRKRLKLYYVTTAIDAKYGLIPVPRYVLFVNDKELLQESYSQYLKNVLREKYPAEGVPIVFSVRSRIRN